MRRTRLALLLLAIAAVACSLVPAAEARRGPCIPGLKTPKCRVWTGKVMAVADGDTVNVRIRQDGVWSSRRDIRMVAIQAMELTNYSRKRGRKGACHAVEAAERLEFLLQGRRVRRKQIRIAAFRPRSGGSRGRLRRAIAYRSGGRWHDAGATLMKEGHALWDPSGKDWAWNRRYGKLAARAASAGRNLWDTDYCSAGPSPATVVTVAVKWDANGSDGRHPNGEYLRVTNWDPVNSLPLRGWWVRDSALRRFRFPRETSVPPRKSVFVRVGEGTDRGNTFHWGQDDPIFQNATRGRKGIGDGGYLFDPQGDLRAWHLYPGFAR